MDDRYAFVSGEFQYRLEPGQRSQTARPPLVITGLFDKIEDQQRRPLWIERYSLQFRSFGACTSGPLIDNRFGGRRRNALPEGKKLTKIVSAKNAPR